MNKKKILIGLGTALTTGVITRKCIKVYRDAKKIAKEDKEYLECLDRFMSDLDRICDLEKDYLNNKEEIIKEIKRVGDLYIDKHFMLYLNKEYGGTTSVYNMTNGWVNYRVLNDDEILDIEKIKRSLLRCTDKENPFNTDSNKANDDELDLVMNNSTDVLISDSKTLASIISKYIKIK